MKVRLSALARRDLREILIDLAAENIIAARALNARFIERFQQLSRFPEMGRSRPDIAPRARGLLIAPYVIFYSAEPSKIIVLRVLHGSRDLREVVLP